MTSDAFARRERPAPLVSVLVGYETLKGRVCQLANGVVITPGTVASLLDEALIERVVFDGPSRVIDLGRARRFTGAVRRARRDPIRPDHRDRRLTGGGLVVGDAYGRSLCRTRTSGASPA